MGTKTSLQRKESHKKLIENERLREIESSDRRIRRSQSYELKKIQRTLSDDVVEMFPPKSSIWSDIGTDPSYKTTFTNVTGMGEDVIAIDSSNNYAMYFDKKAQQNGWKSVAGNISAIGCSVGSPPMAYMLNSVNKKSTYSYGGGKLTQLNSAPVDLDHFISGGYQIWAVTLSGALYRFDGTNWGPIGGPTGAVLEPNSYCASYGYLGALTSNNQTFYYYTGGAWHAGSSDYTGSTINSGIYAKSKACFLLTTPQYNCIIVTFNMAGLPEYKDTSASNPIITPDNASILSPVYYATKSGLYLFYNPNIGQTLYNSSVYVGTPTWYLLPSDPKYPPPATINPIISTYSGPAADQAIITTTSTTYLFLN